MIYSRVFIVCTLVVIVSSGCGHKSPAGRPESLLNKDSLYKDGLRKKIRDSLAAFIYYTNCRKIRLPEKAPIDIEECITQLDKGTNDTIKLWMKFVKEGEFIRKEHFLIGLTIRNKWGLWANSRLCQFFESRGLFQPDEMSGVILGCFHQYVITGKYEIDKKIKYCSDYLDSINAKKKRKEESDRKAYLRSKRFVDSINKLIHYDDCFSKIDGLVKDSLNFYIEQRRGDTIILWSDGYSGRLTEKEYLYETKLPEFGKTLFFGFINNDGGIFDKNLKKTLFIRKKNALYFQEEGSSSFVKIFTSEMATDISISNSWKPTSRCSFNSSKVKFYWKLNGKKYYYLEILGKCHESDLEVRYIIDKNLNPIFEVHLVNRLWQCKKYYH